MSEEAGPITIALESPEQAEVLALFRASDSYHQALYPDESNYLLDPAELAIDSARFIVARQDGVAVGCGAIVVQGEGSAELKRMWVGPETRGTGLGRRLLNELEQIARAENCIFLRLETGVSQPEAISLYKSSGFSVCPPFSGYTEDPLSIFMEKQLGESLDAK